MLHPEHKNSQSCQTLNLSAMRVRWLSVLCVALAEHNATVVRRLARPPKSVRRPSTAPKSAPPNPAKERSIVQGKQRLSERLAALRLEAVSVRSDGAQLAHQTDHDLRVDILVRRGGH